MSVTWTREQQQVISLRNRNILVSAAAGSGKTAVLVERILSMVTDPVQPVDIDRLLIVTFTKAAAGEMRERIRDAIEKKIEEEPDNEHLQRQTTLIHNAQITTIHSFCQYVLRNHFHAIGLDPGFRVADEGELKLLRHDTAETLLEEAYASESEAFTAFAEQFATGKGDEEIIDCMLSIYQYSMSFPWPKLWLTQCKKAYQPGTMEEFVRQPWLESITQQTERILADMEQETLRGIALCRQEGGPYMYVEALESDLALLRSLGQAKNYREYSEKFLSKNRFARLSAKKDAAVSEGKKEEVKAIRAQVKEGLDKLQQQYFFASAEQMKQDMEECRTVMEELLDLTGAFLDRFAEKKREKNVVDFNDLEHMALEILLEGEGEDAKPSEIAREFSNQYEEILIDEYQDSNLVQEYLLNSISRAWQGRDNVFMVGDVKQSIYRFRLARPELFMEKHAAYTLEESDHQRVELHKNFRSRAQVLAGVNFLFTQIMTRKLGNVEYDREAALYAGASFPEDNRKEFGKTEVLLLDLEQERQLLAESGETQQELEARMVGNRIREIVGKELILDQKTGEYRPAQYRDMVILLRTVSGWAQSFAAVLKDLGIPAYTGSQTGYFSTVEVQTILALLRVLDNPKQDIPLTAVLRSPICGLEDGELASIRCAFPEGTFESACRRYAAGGEVETIREKLENFLNSLEHFRGLVPYTPMHELLAILLEETGYGDYAAAMPGGSQRKANLDMLVEKAMAYESTSYRGLFHFIRYIEQLQKYDVDFGEASVLGEEEDTVRIMSIHKSKGLEYPIVFVSGLAKPFNQQDLRSKVAMHGDLGVGCDWVNPTLRIKAPTLIKKTIQRQTANENLGEELRILYVAATRAKEKLILTGAVKKLEKQSVKWRLAARQQEQQFCYSALAQAASYLDWLMPALLRHRDGEKLWEAFGADAGNPPELEWTEAEYEVRIVGADTLAGEEAIRQIQGNRSIQEWLNWNPGQVTDEEVRRRLQDSLEAKYAYEDCMDIYGTMSVSELKRQGTQMEETVELYREPEVVPLIPRFKQAEEAQTGATLGTLYHKFLEHLDYGRTENREQVLEQLEQMTKQRRFLAQEAHAISTEKIWRFLTSPIGRRMKEAARRGELHREQQFVLGVPANQLQERWKTDEPVMVQGIIDAYFYEEGKIILVDYKTDRVSPGMEGKLLEKYRVQLTYYAKALEQLTGVPVAEQYLYSFAIQKELRNL